MISIDEIKRIAWLKGIKSAGNAEKDYLLDIALLSVSRSTKDELIFKGGTCLSKFYKLDRFSEDLDFTLRKELDIDGLLKKICSVLSSFGIESEIRDKKSAYNSVMATIRAKGPLYKNTPMSLSNIGIDINLKSSIDMEPEPARYNSLYPDVPSFSILVMQEPEILAEKIRAVMTRTKARDVYDIWFLLGKGVEFDEILARKKTEYYKQEWNPKEFIKRIDAQKAAWKTELGPIVSAVPDFREVKKLILEKIS